MFTGIKRKLTGERKILILFSILLIFNLALFISLFNYMIDINQIDMLVLEDFITINSALIILGFTSTRLPKLREKKNGPLYEISYLILIGLLSLTISYFNESTKTKALWMPFIEMFRMLSIILILTYIATRSKSFKSIVMGDRSRKTVLWQIIICSMLGILASYVTLDINGAPANARGLVVVISALLGGPYVGIPVGIISGLWRFSIGGSTALACSIGTILAGIAGSVAHRWNGNEFLKSHMAIILMFLYSGFEMFLITALTPGSDGFIFAGTLYAPMTFAAMFGMFLFTLFLNEKKEELGIIDDSDQRISEDDDRMAEMTLELKEYEDKIEELENELDKLKEYVKKQP